MLRLSYFPPVWKHSVIIMVPKPNKPKHQILSYRPISLLQTLGKLCEKILHKHITLIIQENNIIPKTQLGIRTNTTQSTKFTG